MRTERFESALLSTLLIVSLTAPAISLLQTTPASATPDGLIPRAPILIVGNENFTPANGVVAGSGTENDPYIIENWDISAENANGIWIKNTTAYFVIRNVHVHDGWVNYKYGIYFENVMNGRAENARVENNTVGIGLLVSDNNLIYHNNIVRNDNVGIYLGGSDNNRIYHNNFINNVDQAFDIGSNYWDNGYPWGGNYWSDYTGADDYGGEDQNRLGSDWIGDAPYYIPGDNNRDRYPLMSPFPLPWTGWADFEYPPIVIIPLGWLDRFFAVHLEKNLVLYQGSKLVVKFYTLLNEYENESVIENFTPPWHVKENEVVLHPEKYIVRKARLDLTYDNTENVISTIASFSLCRDGLFGIIMEIKGWWPFADDNERNAIFVLIMEIKAIWPLIDGIDC